MRKFLTFFLLIFCTSNLVLGQDKEEEYILTKEDNAKWFKQLRKEKLNFDIIKERIDSDQEVFYSPKKDLKANTYIKKGFVEKSNLRPLYIFTTENIDFIESDNSQFILPDNPSKKLVKKIKKLKIGKHISGISTLNSNTARALFGDKAQIGVIKIKLTKERFLRRLKRVK